MCCVRLQLCVFGRVCERERESECKRKERKQIFFTKAIAIEINGWQVTETHHKQVKCLLVEYK